jgi:tetratricopeptide (TPR) repeat protein
LFTTDVKTSVNSTKVNVSAGGMYLERAKITEDSIQKRELLNNSIHHLTTAANLYSKNDVVWLLLGNVYIELKDYPMSTFYLTNSLKVNNAYRDALHNLLYVAQETNKEKQYENSKIAYKTLIHYQPNNLEHLIDLANVYENAQQIDSALYFLNRTINIDSLNYRAYSKIGEIYGKYLGQLPTAIAYLNKAYNIKPDDASINENLGVAYGISRNFDLSIKHLNEAIKINPNNPQSYINMAGSYNNMGRQDLAQKAMIKAQEIKQANETKNN